MHSPGPTPESESVGLRWGPEICIFNTRCPRDCAVIVPEPNFSKYQFKQHRHQLTPGQNTAIPNRQLPTLVACSNRLGSILINATACTSAPSNTVGVSEGRGLD